MKRILALAPHPDDIEIGCGGTLAVYAKQVATIHLFVATDGSKGGDSTTRKSEQECAAKILGIQAVHWGDFADTKLPAEDTLIHALEDKVREIKPDFVLVNHHEDTHQDHRTLARAAHSATRYVSSVLAYETPTSSYFTPTVFMDIHDTLSDKLKALDAHASQVEKTNIQGLNIVEIAPATARFRGVQGKISCAEAFMPIRIQL